MKTNKNIPYFLFHKLTEEEQDKVRRKFMIYGDESKILVDKHGRPCIRYYQASGVLSTLDLIQFGHIGLIKANEEKDHLNLPQLVLFGDYLVKGIMSGYSYFPIRKEYVYGNEKAYNRE